MRADPPRRSGVARPGHHRRPRRPLLRALPAPRGDQRREAVAVPLAARRRTRPRRHGRGDRRAHPPRDRVQPQQPHRGVPARRCDRAVPRPRAGRSRRARRRGVLRLRRPARRRPDMSLARRASQPARDAHVQQGARPLRPARGLRGRLHRLDRRPSTRCASRSTPTPSPRRRRSRACAIPRRSRGASPRPSASARRVEAALTDLGVPFTPSQANFILLHADSDMPDERIAPRGSPPARGHRRDGAALGVPGTIRRHDRDRAGERRVPGRAQPGLTRSMSKLTKDGRRHDDRDAGGRDRRADPPRRRTDRGQPGRGRTSPAASSSRSSARSATTASSSRRCQLEGEPGRREGRPDPQAVQARLARLPRRGPGGRGRRPADRRRTTSA